MNILYNFLYNWMYLIIIIIYKYINISTLYEQYICIQINLKSPINIVQKYTSKLKITKDYNIKKQ